MTPETAEALRSEATTLSVEARPAWVAWVVEGFPVAGEGDAAPWGPAADGQTRFDDLPLRLRTAIQLSQALAHYNLAYAFSDTDARAEVQRPMARRLVSLARELATTEPALINWNSESRRKPEPVPWDLAGREKPQPDPWVERRVLPRGGQLSRDLVCALALYKLAFGLNDVEARSQVQAAVGRQVGALVHQLASLRDEA